MAKRFKLIVEADPQSASGMVDAIQNDTFLNPRLRQINFKTWVWEGTAEEIDTAEDRLHDFPAELDFQSNSTPC